MRVITTAALVALGLTFAQTVRADDIKLGYVNILKVQQEYKEFQDAQAKFEKEAETWQKQADAKKKEIMDADAELQAQRLVLTDAKIKEKTASLDAKKEEYQKFVAATFGEDGEMARRNKELTAPILQKLDGAVKRVAADGRYTMIFELSQGNILYAKDGLDLTDATLKELNKDAK